MHKLAQLDHQYLWHPFTQMQDWLKREPIVIVRGKGAVLHDVQGKAYLDANASIWTNLHGHAHPKINAAVRRQLNQIAHSSALGFANGPASLLGAELVHLANAVPSSTGYPGRPRKVARRSARSGRSSVTSSPSAAHAVGSIACNGNPSHFERVFFSDDGSTAVEVALKLAYEFARRSGRSPKPKFLSLRGAYHGDTIGAVSLGHIDLFHQAYSRLLFKSENVSAPYCYRCPHNRSQPQRADARDYRKCDWECVDEVERKFARERKRGNPLAAIVLEPLVQGAAGIIAQPNGWLKRVAEIARSDGAQLIADEVMTGFGRTGTWFACQAEGVQPDFLAVAKGLTGGYLPMAATLTTGKVFDAFLGDYAEFKTFFHGHSFTGNQLGAAAALASLDLLQTRASISHRNKLENILKEELGRLWTIPQVGDVRQVGLIAGIELVRNWRTREAFSLSDQIGIRVCEAMAARGVLTRPIGNVVVLMPPYCMTVGQVRRMVRVLAASVKDVCGQGGSRHFETAAADL